MRYHYLDDRLANDPHTLPSIETFVLPDDESTPFQAGWYYWFCFPGYMPDGEPVGPFDTEEAALDAARNGD